MNFQRKWGQQAKSSIIFFHVIYFLDYHRKDHLDLGRPFRFKWSDGKSPWQEWPVAWVLVDLRCSQIDNKD